MPKVLQRKCRCNSCHHEWTDAQTLFRKEQPVPPQCPQCSAGGHNAASVQERDGLNEIISSGKAPVMGGNRAASRAGDLCGRMLEEDYHIPSSLIRDNVKEGEIGVKIPDKPDHLQTRYLGSGSSNDVTKAFLESAKSSGGLGPNENMSGIDILQGAAKAGKVLDPLKHSEFYRTKD